jgi:hypothetical protein
MSDAVAICFNCGQLKMPDETELSAPGITAAAAKCGICKRHPFHERELFAAGLLTDEVFDLVDLLDLGKRIGRTGGISLTDSECDAVVAKVDKSAQRSMAMAAIVRAERAAAPPAVSPPKSPSRDWRSLSWMAASVVFLFLAIAGGKQGGFVGWSLCVVTMLGFMVSAGAMMGRK